MDVLGAQALQNSIRKTPRPIAMPPLDNASGGQQTPQQQPLAGPAVGIRNLRNNPNMNQGGGGGGINIGNSNQSRGNVNLNGLTPPGRLIV